MTLATALGPRAAARHFQSLYPKVSHALLINAAKRGEITTANAKGEPTLFDLDLVAEWLRHKYQPQGVTPDYSDLNRVKQQQVEIQVRQAQLQDRPPEGTPINLTQAARKYNVGHSVMASWARRLEVTILQYPAKNGDPTIVDDSSVWDRMQTYKPRPRKLGQGQLIPTGNGTTVTSRPPLHSPPHPTTPLPTPPHHSTSSHSPAAQVQSCPTCGGHVCPYCGRPLP